MKEEVKIDTLAIRERMLSEIKKFKLENSYSSDDDVSDFFALKRHKIRNWKNSPSKPAPLTSDLALIEKVQRSARGLGLKYKINTFFVFSGYEKSEREEKKDEKIYQLEQLYKEVIKKSM